MANYGISNVPRDYFASESLTIAGSSTSLTAGTYAPATSASPATAASYAFITVETDQVRFWLDATVPTATTGHLLNIGDSIELHGTNTLRNFRAIRVTTSATLRVSYAR